jgi:hypothetical protein
LVHYKRISSEKDGKVTLICFESYKSGAAWTVGWEDSGNLHGNITKLKYEIPYRADYINEEINGEFSHATFIPQ